MKKFLLLTCFVTLFVFNVQGQVTVGSSEEPHSKALLDLNQGLGTDHNESEKGFFLPRVNLLSTTDFFGTNEHKEGVVVYNRNTSGMGVVAAERVYPGFYYNSGSKWERLYFGTTNWFYMPSIAIDVTTSGEFTRDLYLEYRKQFEDSQDSQIPANSPAAGTALIASPDAPNHFSTLFATDKLYYYVTGYDAAVFSNLGIDKNGVLTYTVDADNVTDATYMNIVFVVK